MSANDAVKADLPMRDLRHISPDEVVANKANPRLHFPEKDLDRLAESIERDGVLVPIVVFESGESDYTLVDGERRWRCAKTLGLETIPAIVTDPSDQEGNLLQMFNIHMVREQWDEMPTAWALGRLMNETQTDDSRELADMTGLSTENIQRYKHALDLPEEYQTLIDNGDIPLNFFWELKKGFLDPLKKKRPSLANELSDEKIVNAFVEKWQNKVTTNAVAPRQLSRIVAEAAREEPGEGDANEIDETLRRLVSEPTMSIQDAYDQSVGINVEADKLEQRLETNIRTFRRLVDRADSAEERQKLSSLRAQFVERMQEIAVPE